MTDLPTDKSTTSVTRARAFTRAVNAQHVTCSVSKLSSKTKALRLQPLALDSIGVEAFRRHSPKRDFCRALLDLREHWFSNRRDCRMDDDGVTYREMCGRNEWRLRYADHTYLGLFMDFVYSPNV
ncbi:hypothetical protein M3J09_013288 [Ascochyta lentis]